ncbi:MAG: SpaH/EbpB family LPXTG-anchored major pilin [Clostridia bacterium]|nr:SpaH/EbpB family LPXTG-anchored major pilin [Clostridia bacterium]
MKKIMTKITAVIATLLLTFSMFTFTVTAAPRIADTDKGSITVTNVTDNATATAYKILNVKYDYDANQPSNPEYYWADEVKEFVKNNYPDYISADGSVNEEKYSSMTADQSKKFFEDVALAIKEGTITLAGTSNGQGNTTISNLEMGSYLVLIEGGVKVYQSIAVNVVPTYNEAQDEWAIDNQTITNTKSTAPTVDKTADKTNVSVNEKVSYTVTATVPSYPANATANQFVVSDKLPAGLTYNGDVKVYGVGTGDSVTELAENTAYTVSTSRPDNKGTVDFAVSLVYNQVSTYKTIKVVYTATANKDIVLGQAGNVNTAYIDYNNNPYDNGSWKDDSDTATVHTYGIDITKVDKKNHDTTLAGAEFTLSATNGGEAIKFVKTENGRYKVADASQTADAVDTLVTVTSGKLYIEGLKAGTYYLKETKAPTGGYKVPLSAFEITIADDDNDGNVNDAESAYVAQVIENTTGYTLPSTGGMGTVMFTVGGIVLVALGAGMIVVLRKKSKTAE